MQVLVRVAPEINLKSPRVKSRFLNILIKNMRAALAQAGVAYTIENRWSRLYVTIDTKAGIAALSRVFGIASLSPIEHFCEPRLEVMKAIIVDKYKDEVAGKSLCIRVKRSQVSGFSSLDAEVALGSELGAFARKIDLTNPDFKLEVDVNPRGAHFFSARIPGPQGLPLGSQGKALCLISGGFDSAVAAWRMMKRGVALDFAFCNLAGAAYERSVLAVVKGLCQQWAYGFAPDIYVLDYQDIATAINKNVRPSYAQVVLKRTFYRTCGALAQKIGAKGLVTGEAVGQVSSQTLANLQVIDVISPVLIMRPLVSFDKDEILAIARKIGTYLLCEHIQEYCALNPKKPVTEAKVAAVDDQEQQLPQELRESCLSTVKKLAVSSLSDRDLMTSYLFTDSIPEAAVVIDSRSREEFDAWHYPGALHLTMKMLSLAYKKFDKSQVYILVCPFGLQTAVIAEKMQALGYESYSYLGGAQKLRKNEARDHTEGISRTKY